MKRFFILVAILGTTFSIKAQTKIINAYAQILGMTNGACATILSVDSPSLFDIGDAVLIVQIKGAFIDSSNTNAFGNITAYNNVGNFEFNEIVSKSGTNLILKTKLIKSYDIINGTVQLVAVKKRKNYDLNTEHSCLGWNGKKGGVFFIDVSDSLFLNSNINVTAKGFTGGEVLLSTAFSCNRRDYFYSSIFNEGAHKGEGISSISINKIYGRGKLANGGGGGNDHNCGGGGGGNGGAGGKGGNQYFYPGGPGCTEVDVAPFIAMGGLGGQSLDYSVNRVFLGGGGGAGQGNDRGEKPGGIGGGIVFIKCNVLIANNNSIIANGQNAIECSAAVVGCQDDGTGGGGAGGSILLDVASYIGLVNVTANGGKGADCWVSKDTKSTRQVGPGGGGGGGVIGFSSLAIPPGTVNSVIAGLNGVNPQWSNDPWGSEKGSNGKLLTNFLFPEGSTSITRFAQAGNDTIICPQVGGISLPLLASGGVLYSWSPSTGLSNATIANPIATISNTITYVVTVTDANDCIDKDTITITVKPGPIDVIAFPKNITGCLGTIAQLNAIGTKSYLWQPSAGLDDDKISNPKLTISGINTYVVIGTDTNGCADKDTVYITSFPLPNIKISSDNSIVDCSEKAVVLTASGALSYQWTPAIYCEMPNAASTKVRPPATTVFTVKGININGCEAEDTITVFYEGKTVVKIPNAFTPNDDNINDKIKPIIVCDFVMTEFSIYNRWGNNVFITNDGNQGWDGKSTDGKPCELGVYYYYIKGKNSKGEDVLLKGDITMIR
ncbi:MAG: gliding motility-associated C-terminal domain-containing protein [Chitinophagaceae bacterium]|nr:gliding motility-associated C-terminal domain-containing protein [Chitinophagaceae bacterium]